MTKLISVFLLGVVHGSGGPPPVTVEFAPMSPDGERMRQCAITKLYDWFSHEDFTAKRTGPLTFEGITEGTYGLTYRCLGLEGVAELIKIDAQTLVVPVADLTKGNRISLKKGIPLGLHVRFARAEAGKTDGVDETGRWIRATEVITNRSWTARLDADSEGVLAVGPAFYNITVSGAPKGLCAITLQVHRYYSRVVLDSPNRCRVVHADGVTVIRTALIGASDKGALDIPTVPKSSPDRQ